jgi:DNA (cytosine-5)-methyltransferase 1
LSVLNNRGVEPIRYIWARDRFGMTIKRAIDLYSGIGGWTLGMKLSGIENIASFEWWEEANKTHNYNFKTDHKEINIREIDVTRDLIFEDKIDFVVGSPPCTQFSFANKGGNGNIEDGLIDIYKFLEVVEHLKPTYWAMENVPRVASILEKELLIGGSLERFRHLVKVITIVDCSQYGVPQSRKRMVAGDFPFYLFDSYKKTILKKTLGDVISALSQESIVDPNYGYKEERLNVTELENESDLTVEEERINRDSKTYHPVYNKMAFPENLDKPSRTVTATCTRVSRESIIVKSRTGYRRLNVRERGVVQGFPITYQFYGKTLSAKFKMIGNAVPPLLTYYLFQSMQNTSILDLKHPDESPYTHKKPEHPTFQSKLDVPSRKYSDKRRFQFAIPNLRFGSGVRFELSNYPSDFNTKWSFKFFYGNSKNIKEIVLDRTMKDKLGKIVNTTHNHVFTECAEKINGRYEKFKSENIQEVWTSTEVNREVFDFIDDIGECVKTIIQEASFDCVDNRLLESILNEKNKKLLENSDKVITGLYFLSTLNTEIFD